MAKKHILVADDEKETRMVLSLILRRAGYDVTTAENGLKALELITEYKESNRAVDLVLADIQMPKMGGLELLERISQWDLAVIVITGFGDKSTIRQTLRKGGVDFLDKPFEEQDIIDSVTKALSQTNKIRKERHEAKKYRNIVENVEGGICQVDNAGIILDVNNHFCRILGYSSEELIGMLLAKLFCTGISDNVKPETIFLASKKLHVDCCLYNKNGSRKWTIFATQPLFNQNGEFQGVRAMVTDITRRKQKEQEERARLITAIEQATECIVRVDTEGNIRYVNKAFEHLHHFSCEQIIDKNIAIIDKNKDRLFREIQRVVQSGVTWNGHNQNFKKDLSYYEAYCTISPIRNQNNKIIDCLVTIRDITEQLYRDRQLQVYQKIESLGILAGGITHDLNNMMSPIMCFSELLKEMVPVKDEDLHEYIDYILLSCKKVQNLVRHLRTFCSSDVKEREIVSLDTLIKEMLHLLKPSISEKIQLSVHFPNFSCQVVGDSGQLYQVVLNLVINALQSMEHKSGQLSLTLKEIEISQDQVEKFSLSHAGHYWQLLIEDQGSGIRRENLEKIFAPFFSTKSPEKNTGMGLAIVHNIIQEHGGSITVESQWQQGTCFSILLPKINMEWQNKEIEVTSLAGKKLRILFVDDDDYAMAAGKAVLAYLGHEAIGFKRSEQAFQEFCGNPGSFDLAILDQVMPGLSGLQLSRKMLKISPHFPIILCSGYSVEITTENLKRAGIHSHLKKPFTLKKLFQAIRSIEK